LRLDRVDIFHLHNAITETGGGEALGVQQVLGDVVPAFVPMGAIRRAWQRVCAMSAVPFWRRTNIAWAAHRADDTVIGHQLLELLAGCSGSGWRWPAASRLFGPDTCQKHDLRLIHARIPDAEVTIRDLAGDGDHYAATVIAESFRGKSRVQQHQIVYEALKAEMGGKLHALALQTGIPDR
jgi:stress-induced morphogen